MLFMNQITNYDKLEALWNAAENCHIRKPEPRRYDSWTSLIALILSRQRAYLSFPKSASDKEILVSLFWSVCG